MNQLNQQKLADLDQQLGGPVAVQNSEPSVKQEIEDSLLDDVCGGGFSAWGNWGRRF